MDDASSTNAPCPGIVPEVWQSVVRISAHALQKSLAMSTRFVVGSTDYAMTARIQLRRAATDAVGVTRERSFELRFSAEQHERRDASRVDVEDEKQLYLPEKRMRVL